MGNVIIPLWFASLYDRSNQCSTTGPSKVVVCDVLSVGKVHINDPLLVIKKSSLCGDSGFPVKKHYNDHMVMVTCLMSNS